MHLKQRIVYGSEHNHAPTMLLDIMIISGTSDLPTSFATETLTCQNEISLSCQISKFGEKRNENKKDKKTSRRFIK